MQKQIEASGQIQAAFRGWQVRSALVAEVEKLVAETDARTELQVQPEPNPDPETQVLREMMAYYALYKPEFANTLKCESIIRLFKS
eukprot:COSAG02_NODE_43387_length_375_cov_0.905797_1_plen_85_part_10